MTGTGTPSSDGGGLHGVEIRREAVGFRVALVALRRADASATIADVWSTPVRTAAGARRLRDRMLRLPHRWTTWAMLAPIVGAVHLDAIILLEASRERSRRDPGPAGGALMPVAEGDGRVPANRRVLDRVGADVRFDLVLAGVPRIVAYGEGVAFLAMRFEAEEGARRVWDWLRWQRHAFASWYALALREGPDAVERLVLISMVRQEDEAGDPADRARPLRLWRPRRR